MILSAALWQQYNICYIGYQVVTRKLSHEGFEQDDEQSQSSWEIHAEPVCFRGVSLKLAKLAMGWTGSLYYSCSSTRFKESFEMTMMCPDAIMLWRGGFSFLLKLQGRGEFLNRFLQTFLVSTIFRPVPFLDTPLGGLIIVGNPFCQIDDGFLIYSGVGRIRYGYPCFVIKPRLPCFI